MTRNKAVLRFIFAVSAFCLSAGLSFRPIPSFTDSNDTGRYVVYQKQACSLPILGDSFLPAPLRAFNLLLRPTCLDDDPRLFLILTAAILPLALILFGSWDHQSAIILAGALMLSTIGFEFMTNALRQGVSLSFLLGGFFFEKRLAKFGALAAAVLIHDSTWFFIPLAIWLSYSTGTSNKKTIYLWWALGIATAGYLFTIRFLPQLSEGAALAIYYNTRYSGTLSTPFLLYIVSPLLIIYLARISDHRARPTKEERITFWYSVAVLAISTAFFPVITFRFAMTGIVLQIFMTMRSPNISIRSCMLIAYGLITHFIIYAVFSNNVTTVLHG